MAASASHHWKGLRAGDPEATACAREEAAELARAIVAHALLADPDAELAELPERLESELEILWPEGDPCQGYELESSFGAYLIARSALELVPSGRRALRHTPLDRAGMIAALIKQGVDEDAARATLGDWQEVWPDFQARSAGLSISALAGLAERSLGRTERDRALCQIAYSPRCLMRLSASLNLLATVRAVLGGLPPAAAGESALIATAGVLLGAPDRALELLADEDHVLCNVARRELLEAQLALSEGRAPELPEDALLRLPVEGEAAAEGEEDEDDILEMVEEGAETVAQLIPPRWGLSPEEQVEAEQIEAWQARRRAAGSLLSQRGSLLGLSPARSQLTLRPSPLGPDIRLLHERLDPGAQLPETDPRQEGKEAELLMPPLRGAIRLAAAAAEGQLPSAAALSQSGCYEWLVLRAQALAHVVRGELDPAVQAASTLGAAAPELRWAEARRTRFGGRAPAPVEPAEARRMAAGLIADLHVQLARSLAATTPSDDPEGASLQAPAAGLGAAVPELPERTEDLTEGA